MADETPTQIPFVDPRQVGLWAVVNAIQQKFALEGAYLKDKFPDGKFEPVPFGSTIINMTSPVEKQQETVTPAPVTSSPEKPVTAVDKPTQIQPVSSFGNKLIQGLILGTGVLGGGLGLAAFLKPDKTIAPIVSEPEKDSEPKIIEGILEWEFNSEKGLDLKKNGSESNTRGIIPETNSKSRKKSTGLVRKME